VPFEYVVFAWACGGFQLSLEGYVWVSVFKFIVKLCAKIYVLEGPKPHSHMPPKPIRNPKFETICQRKASADKGNPKLFIHRIPCIFRINDLIKITANSFECIFFFCNFITCAKTKFTQYW
jgi:hypothetical protein